MYEEAVGKIKEIIEPVLLGLGLELVDIQLRNESAGLVLRVTIYKESGVSIDDCSLVSREVGYLLEIDDPIASAYTLEVSSPGLDRPLKTGRDFERNIGKKVTVLYDDQGEKSSVTGCVVGHQDGLVVLGTSKEEVKVPLDSIVKAKLVIEF